MSMNTGDSRSRGAEELSAEDREMMEDPLWEILAVEGHAEYKTPYKEVAELLAEVWAGQEMPLLGRAKTWIEEEDGVFYTIVELEDPGSSPN